MCYIHVQYTIMYKIHYNIENKNDNKTECILSDLSNMSTATSFYATQDTMQPVIKMQR